MHIMKTEESPSPNSSILVKYHSCHSEFIHLFINSMYLYPASFLTEGSKAVYKIFKTSMLLLKIQPITPLYKAIKLLFQNYY